MQLLAKSDYRGKDLTYEQFRDLTIIGMAGLSDHLMSGPSPYADGMVNYKHVAESLGLKFSPDWLERLGHDLDNGLESIVSHDGAPDGHQTDDNWVYLNAGFGRLASMLRDKYYFAADEIFPLDYHDFRDLLLFELVGLAEADLSEVGEPFPPGAPETYDLSAVAKLFDLRFETEWLNRICREWIDSSLVEPDDSGRVRVTPAAFEAAQELGDKLGTGDGIMLGQKTGRMFFSVDASHISRLGMELVAKQETAVAELVKNGYDADATRVDLMFELSDADNSSLIITDNGTGMDIEQLDNGFMRLSTPNKALNPRSDKFCRQKAGRKGIGRFAAQRLGRRLVLETTTEDLFYGLRLEIDWDQFGPERTLSSVPNQITRTQKLFTHGTRLTITGLRDMWTDAQIERSHRHIAELIQPFPLELISNNEGSDPGFKASFTRGRKGEVKVIADDWTLYFRHALAEIEGGVDDAGFGFWSVRSDRFGIKAERKPISLRRETPSEPFPHLRNVRFKAYYYIDKETQRSFRSAVAEKLQSSGGIRLYRNGFRVLPYGERFDDWLKLNASNLLRKVLPPHSNRNFLGFVEINDVDGTQFEETSSREGLVENESFAELKDFVSACLKSAILPIADARERRLTTTDTRQKQRSPKGQADDILRRLETLQKNAAENETYALALSEVLDSVKKSILDIGDTGEALLEELGMMRVLASLGLTIGEFTHEIRLALEAVRASAALLTGRVLSDAPEASQAAALMEQIADFEGYLTYFDATVRDNVSRDVTSLEIRDVVNSFIRVVSPKLNRNELRLDHSFDGYGLFTRPMHRSEWASILINLFTNSLKAIRRKGVQGHIHISCGRLDGRIFLDFMDNGDGIPEGNQRRIFDAFFTTTAATGASEEDNTFAGMGMGLKIVRDIIETAQGEISLRPPPEGFATCFRILVPEATDEELPPNAY